MKNNRMGCINRDEIAVNNMVNLLDKNLIFVSFLIFKDVKEIINFQK
jgi:hypothetical protein